MNQSTQEPKQKRSKNEECEGFLIFIQDNEMRKKERKNELVGLGRRREFTLQGNVVTLLMRIPETNSSVPTSSKDPSFTDHLDFGDTTA